MSVRHRRPGTSSVGASRRLGSEFGGNRRCQERSGDDEPIGLDRGAWIELPRGDPTTNTRVKTTTELHRFWSSAARSARCGAGARVCAHLRKGPSPPAWPTGPGHRRSPWRRTRETRRVDTARARMITRQVTPAREPSVDQQQVEKKILPLMKARNLHFKINTCLLDQEARFHDVAIG